jgi:hypothetical protein
MDGEVSSCLELHGSATGVGAVIDDGEIAVVGSV